VQGQKVWGQILKGWIIFVLYIYNLSLTYQLWKFHLHNWNVMTGETYCISYLYVSAALYLFPGADYGDGDSTEGNSSKEKGTINVRRNAVLL
jgi:hypothetical protein